MKRAKRIFLGFTPDLFDPVALKQIRVPDFHKQTLLQISSSSTTSLDRSNNRSGLISRLYLHSSLHGMYHFPVRFVTYNRRTAFCFTLPYVTSQGDLTVLFFKIGTVSGALAMATQLARKFLQLRKITPLQHKVRGLVRAFKNGTIRYRDSEEVMLSSLN